VSPAARSRLAVGEAGATGDAGADILRSAVRYGAPPAAAARACPPRSKGRRPLSFLCVVSVLMVFPTRRFAGGGPGE